MSELVLVRMAGDGVKPVEKRLNYRNAFDGLYRIYQEGGVKGMFRGAVPTTARSVLLNSAQLSWYVHAWPGWPSYDLIKRRLLRTGYFEDSIPLHLLTATLGGTISITICTPVDVIKSRIQASTGQTTLAQVIAKSIKADGATVLFRGWLPAWLRMTPTTALTFMFMEQIKKLV
jgi:dicarboxylate transporter 10